MTADQAVDAIAGAFSRLSMSQSAELFICTLVACIQGMHSALQQPHEAESVPQLVLDLLELLNLRLAMQSQAHPTWSIPKHLQLHITALNDEFKEQLGLGSYYYRPLEGNAMIEVDDGRLSVFLAHDEGDSDGSAANDSDIDIEPVEQPQKYHCSPMATSHPTSASRIPAHTALPQSRSELPARQFRRYIPQKPQAESPLPTNSFSSGASPSSSSSNLSQHPPSSHVTANSNAGTSTTVRGIGPPLCQTLLEQRGNVETYLPSFKTRPTQHISREKSVTKYITRDVQHWQQSSPLNKHVGWNRLALLLHQKRCVLDNFDVDLPPP
ncbi:hypothetical protein CALCODRAFT_541850, partial [Calocera cornea HHB12733]